MKVRDRSPYVTDAYGSEPPTGYLRALCWCARRFVLVKQRDIMDCRTNPCGEPDCHPPTTD